MEREEVRILEEGLCRKKQRASVLWDAEKEQNSLEQKLVGSLPVPSSVPRRAEARLDVP